MRLILCAVAMVWGGTAGAVCIRAIGDEARLTLSLPADVVAVTLADQDGNPLPVWQFSPFGDVPPFESISSVEGHSTLNFAPGAGPRQFDAVLVPGPAEAGQATTYRIETTFASGDMADGPVLTVTRDPAGCGG